MGPKMMFKERMILKAIFMRHFYKKSGTMRTICSTTCQIIYMHALSLLTQHMIIIVLVMQVRNKMLVLLAFGSHTMICLCIVFCTSTLFSFSMSNLQSSFYKFLFSLKKKKKKKRMLKTNSFLDSMFFDGHIDKMHDNFVNNERINGINKNKLPHITQRTQ